MVRARAIDSFASEKGNEAGTWNLETWNLWKDHEKSWLGRIDKVAYSNQKHLSASSPPGQKIPA